jgi:RimJ/RimL family protein N-acetyltransferase
MLLAPAVTIFDFEPIEGEAARRVREILADRGLRIALNGEDARVSEAAAVARWCSGAAHGRRHAARCRSSGQIIGGVGIEAGALLYFVERAQWGQGHGRSIVDQYLRTLPRSDRPLTATVARCNLASRRILDRAGFREAALERRGDCLPSAVVYVQTLDFIPGDE